jgi:hypothetical protein
VGKDYIDKNEACLKNVLEKIVETQEKAKAKMKGKAWKSIPSLNKSHLKNTVPVILYIKDKPFKAEGVSTGYGKKGKYERFICFSTFIFRVIEIKGDCAVLELLKFSTHDHSKECKDHECTPSCQLHYAEVDDLMSTSVCVTVEISCLCAIHCLPPVKL